jgi:hypothetical protein
MDLFVWAWLLYLFFSCMYLGYVVRKTIRPRN